MVGGRDPGALAEYAAAMTGDDLCVRGRAAVQFQVASESGGSDTAMRVEEKKQTWLDGFTASRKRVGE
jgi:hypothetical protein